MRFSRYAVHHVFKVVLRFPDRATRAEFVKDNPGWTPAKSRSRAVDNAVRRGDVIEHEEVMAR